MAHPDDESLWLGGTLLALAAAGARLIIVCATHANDSLRASEFHQACACLHATGFLMDFDDAGGKSKLPDFTSGLNELLATEFRALSEIDLVLTHSPTGDERRHSDHIYCYRYAARWAAKHRLNLAFVTARPLDQLRIVDQGEDGLWRTRLRLAWLTRLAPRIWSWLRTRGLPAAARQLRAELRVVWDVLPIKVVVEHRVDMTAKRQLLGVYQSQIDGLREYEAFSRPTEYVYFYDPTTAQAFSDCLWPVS